MTISECKLCSHSSENEKYNGWSNYATWRVNLEMVDGIMPDDGEIFTDVHALSEYIKDSCEDYLKYIDDETKVPNNLCYDYAMSFLSDVNWYEIANSMTSDYPQIMKGNKIQ